jgi:hypothetical protein
LRIKREARSRGTHCPASVCEEQRRREQELMIVMWKLKTRWKSLEKRKQRRSE